MDAHEAIRRFCDLGPCPRIIEIGAHHGEDTVRFLVDYPSGLVDAYEADPRCLDVLRDVLKGQHRARIYPMAVGDRYGYADWHQSGPDWDQSSSLLRPKEHLTVYPACEFPTTIKVRTVPLDYFTEGPVDLLWMDVQGAEHLVFLGAAATLPNTRYIYTEVDERELYDGQRGLAALMELAPGFTVLWRDENNVLLGRCDG